MTLRHLAALLLAAAPIASAPAFAAADSPGCDRACLTDIADRYVAAVVAHDPAKAPLANNVRFTENGQAMSPGDGLWGTASSVASYRLYVPDTEAGQVGYLGLMNENGNDVLVAFRLKVRDRQVTEAETIVARNARGVANIRAKEAPHPVWREAVPVSRRMSRGDLIETADAYFSGLEFNDGKGYYPFADDCLRIENGTQTTENPDHPYAGFPADAPKVNAMGCKAQFESGYFHFVTGIRDRRFLVVDREQGIVLALAFFDHSGAPRTVTLTSGHVVPSPVSAPVALEVAEAFKIDNGKIRRIEAVMNTAPYRMGPGW